MGIVTVPDNTADALAQLRTTMKYLAGLDPLEMSAGQREIVLDGLEQASSQIHDANRPARAAR